MRPALHSCPGQSTQATCKLIRFDHNPRRSKRGKRQGPHGTLDRSALRGVVGGAGHQPIHAEPGVTAPRTLPTRPPLQLVTNNAWGPDQQAMAAGQTILAPPDASGRDRRPEDVQAASSFHLCCNSASLNALREGHSVPPSSHSRDLTWHTVNYFCPVLKGAKNTMLL